MGVGAAATRFGGAESTKAGSGDLPKNRAENRVGGWVLKVHCSRGNFIIVQTERSSCTSIC